MLFSSNRTISGSCGVDVRSTPPLPPETSDAAVGDARELFERLTRETPRDAEAERAFLRKRIELLRSLPGLTHEEREAAIAQLEEQSLRSR
jgi:hypothetical protein